MAANLPQTIEAVERLYQKLRREGVIGEGTQHLRGDWVQVRSRGAVLCGRVLGEVLAPTENRRVRIAVLTQLGDQWVRPFDVRSCSKAEDARCACAAPDAPAAGAAQARRAWCTSPLGNTGVAA